MGNELNPVILDCKLNNGSVFVYGAGDHSVHLFSHFQMEDYVAGYIDSDPKKNGCAFQDKPVIKPSEIGHIRDSKTVVSSHDYEDEIEATIQRYNANSLPVICLYR